MTKNGGPVVLGVTTYNRVDYLKECLTSWIATRDPALPWYVIVADDGSTDGTLDFLYSGDLPLDPHIIRNNKRGVGGQTNTIFEICRTIGFSFGFKIDDDVLFRKPGWDHLYLTAVQESGFDHLCHLNVALWNAERRPVDVLTPGAPLSADQTGRCSAFTDVYSCMGCLFTFTPRSLKIVGDIDEVNFPIRGDWHIDYSARCCRAGLNHSEHFFDAAHANDFIELQDNVKPTYRPSLDFTSPDIAPTLAPEELARRHAIIRNAQRMLVRHRLVTG
jgi:glycosyltransferase involved in cell wall biosynthesis